MTTEPGFDRRAVVIHPARAIKDALAALRRGYGLLGATALGLSAHSMAGGGPGMTAGIAAPRRRRLIAEGSRILARDDRAARLAAEARPPR